jgi:hypothetical protein
LGLSRNKVAVPEGAAGTPPFWSDPSHFNFRIKILELRMKEQGCDGITDKQESLLYFLDNHVLLEDLKI